MEAASRAGLQLPQTFHRDLCLWITEIARYNLRLDLIGDPPERWPGRHILDCLSLVPIVDAIAGESLLDIGSGAGLPGMILAMARPDLQVTLCEPSGKRAAVLQTISLLLGPRGPLVDQRPVSELPAGAWNICTARAVFPPGSPMLASALRCCSPGGHLLLQRRGPDTTAAEGEEAQEAGLCSAWTVKVPEPGFGPDAEVAEPGRGASCILILEVS